MSTVSIYSDVSDRDDVYQNLLLAAIADYNVNNDEMAICMDSHYGEVDLYIRTGVNTVISSLEDEIANNGVSKAFLESTNSKGIKIIDIIKSTIV